MLDELEDAPEGLTIEELARRLGLPVQKVAPHVGALDNIAEIYPDRVGDKENARWRPVPPLPGRGAA